MSRSHASKKRRFDDKDAELLEQVLDQSVTEETLREKLAQHVQQVRSSFLFVVLRIWSITSYFGICYNYHQVLGCIRCTRNPTQVGLVSGVVHIQREAKILRPSFIVKQ